jgi:L-fuculose-phosphate aldolase
MMLHQQFKQIGEKLFLRGLNNSHSGNISVRQKDDIIITGTGKMLDELTPDDLITVKILPNCEIDKNASMELLVHRAIYCADETIGAVVHAHAPYAIAMANDRNEIIPYDHEGAYFFQKIPVLHAGKTIASDEVAEKIGQYVKTSLAVIVNRHGVFAWGKTLEDAYHFLMVVESACRANYLVEKK